MANLPNYGKPGLPQEGNLNTMEVPIYFELDKKVTGFCENSEELRVRKEEVTEDNS